MNGIINSIVQFLQQGIAAIFKFLQLIWTWSFGQIVAVFSSDWQALPIWKIVVLIVALAAIAYILYRAALVLWSGVVALFQAFVALLSTFVSVLPQIVIAGLIAFGAGYVIQHINF
ncbi:MAG: hypothetical protein ACK4TP_02555 [Hyphomicrobium sp.]